MKKGKLHWVLILTGAAMLLLPNCSQALFTSYLIDASNQLTAARAELTNGTAADRRAAAAIGKALQDLSRPSSNVITDYNLFVKAAAHLRPLGSNPEISLLGSNVFIAFTNDAQALINDAAGRVAALSDLNGQKRAASNAVVAAQKTLNRLSTLDLRQQIVVGRQVFAKIALANHLAALAEAHPIYAPASVVGRTLHHSEDTGDSGEVHFDTATRATDTSGGGGSHESRYTWRKTSPTTATLTLREPQEDGGTSTTTVKLTFTSAGGGTFTFENDQGDGMPTEGNGTFTIE